MTLLVRVGAWFCNAHYISVQDWDHKGEDRTKIAICGAVGERGARWNELSKEASGNICKACSKVAKSNGFTVREKSSEWEQST